MVDVVPEDTRTRCIVSLFSSGIYIIICNTFIDTGVSASYYTHAINLKHIHNMMS